MEEYLVEDFTLSTTMKEKSKQEFRLKLKKEKNEIKKLMLNKIDQLTFIPFEQLSILRELVEKDKILEISEVKKDIDDSVKSFAKINLGHENFKNLTSEDVIIKILPNCYYTFYMETYSFNQNTKKILKSDCKNNGNGNPNICINSMELWNNSAENPKCQVFLYKRIFGIDLFNMADKTKSQNSKYFKNKKITTELLLLLHEIFRDRYHWIRTTVNVPANLIYQQKKWIAVMSYNYAQNDIFDRLDDNLEEIINLIGFEMVSKIFESKFKNCTDYCLFHKEFKIAIEKNLKCLKDK